MERKIGEIFKLNGQKYQVIESKCGDCDGCIFYEHVPFCIKHDKKIGNCCKEDRKDKTHVQFVAVKK